MIAKKARKMCKGLMEKYDDIKLKVKGKPKDIEKLVELRQYMDGVPSELAIANESAQEVLRVYGVLDDLRYLVPQEDIKKKYQMLLCPK